MSSMRSLLSRGVSFCVKGSNLQVGSWLTASHKPAKGSRLWTPGAFGASLLTLLKGRKAMTTRETRFPARRTVRMTAEEEERLREQAANAGLSVSEYVRRLMFGGRPITARTDTQTIRELRRLGGLLKHHFGLVRESGRPEAIAKTGQTLESIRNVIENMSRPPCS